MSMKTVYQVFACDITPRNYSSDWQDHRTFELVASYLNEQKAIEHKNSLSGRGEWSVQIKTIQIME